MALSISNRNSTTNPIHLVNASAQVYQALSNPYQTLTQIPKMCANVIYSFF
jgi:hypothetical protein